MLGEFALEQGLVLVLGEDEHVVVGPEAEADLVHIDRGHHLAADPQVQGADLVTAVDHRVGHADLSVELQGPRLHGQGARGGPRVRGLVDDAQLHAEFGQPQGQDQAGRTGADDQDFGFRGTFDHLGGGSVDRGASHA